MGSERKEGIREIEGWKFHGKMDRECIQYLSDGMVGALPGEVSHVLREEGHLQGCVSFYLPMSVRLFRVTLWWIVKQHQKS